MKFVNAREGYIIYYLINKQWRISVMNVGRAITGGTSIGEVIQLYQLWLRNIIIVNVIQSLLKFDVKNLHLSLGLL